MKKLILGIAVLVAISASGYVYATRKAPTPVTPVVTARVEPKTEPVTPQTLLIEVNARRAQVGVPALQLDERLNQSAQAKCDEMHDQNYYDHVNPTTGRHGYDMARAVIGKDGQYSENLTVADKSVSANSIFTSWFNSEKHKAAALDSRYISTGFGYCMASSSSAPIYRAVVEHFYSPQVF